MKVSFRTSALLLMMCFFGSTILPAQQMVSYTLLDSYTLSELEDEFAAFGIPTFLMAPEYELDAYRVVYTTVDGAGDSTLASGAVIIPRDITCALPICSYQHGTSTRRYGVPSYQSSEYNIGLLFSATGYISCAPDYVGMGDGPGFHPYQHAKSEATSVVDLLRATKELCDTMEARYSDQLFLFGYSQGGHATMAAHKEIQLFHSDEFTVTASAPLSGAYDLDGVQADVIISPDPYPAPVYLPYLLLGYQAAYGIHDSILYNGMVSPYREDLDSLFDGTIASWDIDAYLPPVPSDILNPDTLLLFKADSTHWLHGLLKENSLTDWVPNSPVRICFCSGDNHVSYLNSEVAYEKFMAAGATLVDTVNLGPTLDHGDCVQPALFATKLFFDSFRELNSGFEPDFFIVQESGPGALDAEVEISFPGLSLDDFEFEWNTGATTATLSGIASGNYLVIITDSLGCENEYSVFVDEISVGLEEALSQAMHIFPNPAQSLIQITIEGETDRILTVSLLDMQGRLLFKSAAYNSREASISRQGALPGVYFLKIHLESGREVTRKMVWMD